jgi:hypothetical protein
MDILNINNMKGSLIFNIMIKGLNKYIRDKKGDLKICFHCEKLEDYENNIKIVDLFKKEIGDHNIIILGYKGGLNIKELKRNEYNEYISFINNNNIDNEIFKDLNNKYSNCCDFGLSGNGTTDIITSLILFDTKIYFLIPYENKEKAKKDGFKWDYLKKLWYITYIKGVSNYNILDEYIKDYKIKIVENIFNFASSSL